MLEEILDYRNIQKALKQVISNKGAGGVDGMETAELSLWLETNWEGMEREYFGRQFSSPSGTQGRDTETWRGRQTDAGNPVRLRQATTASHPPMAKPEV
jgi:hypothetical protein